MYATDTRPAEDIVTLGKNADLMILEGMYGETDKLPRAEEVGHMLMTEAAELAKRAQAKRLWLTHYSPAVKDVNLYMDAVRDIFPAAEAGYDGCSDQIKFQEDDSDH